SIEPLRWLPEIEVALRIELASNKVYRFFCESLSLTTLDFHWLECNLNAVSLASAFKGNLIVSAYAFQHNPFDGYALAAQVEQVGMSGINWPLVADVCENDSMILIKIIVR